LGCPTISKENIEIERSLTDANLWIERKTTDVVLRQELKDIEKVSDAVLLESRNLLDHELLSD
jgi:hypothetical protein